MPDFISRTSCLALLVLLGLGIRIHLFAQEITGVPEIGIRPNYAVVGAEPDDIIDVGKGLSLTTTADEALRETPGAVIVREGGVGQKSALFFRGASSEHTLVLIDGIEVNDPSTPGGGFNFSAVDLSLIERIEVYRGANTLRFGSGAIGGVINIITKKGSGPPRPFFLQKVGSHQTVQVGTGILGASRAWDYSLSLNRFSTDGISAADGYPEDDAHRFSTVAGQVGYEISAQTRARWISRYSESLTELDYSPTSTPPYFPSPDDPNYEGRAYQIANALDMETDWSPSWHSHTQISHFYQDRRYSDLPDALNPDSLKSRYRSEVIRVESSSRWRLSNAVNMSFGPSYRQELAAFLYGSPSLVLRLPESSARLLGAFARLDLNSETLLFEAGGRLDSHSLFGGFGTYTVSPGFHFGSNHTTLRTRFASAFKAPSLTQLFDPDVGNPLLEPERVRSEELMVEQRVGDRAFLEVAIFRNHFRNLVQLANRYENVGSARSEGVESTLRGKYRNLQWHLAHTYLEAKNERTGESLLRRPSHSAGAGVQWELSNQLSFGLIYRLRGGRTDIDQFTSARTHIGSYDLWNVSAQYKVDMNLSITGQIENVLDRNFQETPGFATPARSVYVSLLVGL
ncbi:MAG: TonB-dependent receptor plug domain-containing protein [Bdellovibrionales bacterium]